MAGFVTPQWADGAGSGPTMATAAVPPVLTVLMVATPATTVRDEARGLVRAALRSSLAKLMGCPAASVPLHVVPGEPPRLALDPAHCPGGRLLHLSISHEAGLSLAAIQSGARVGVDLMRVADAAMPDSQALAHDYLGPEAAAVLLRHGAPAGPAAFARAWTRHEAAMKCLGLPLQEWSPALGRELGRCDVSELVLPGAYIGAVAVCA